jgi:hypothetical protein
LTTRSKNLAHFVSVMPERLRETYPAVLDSAVVPSRRQVSHSAEKTALRDAGSRSYRSTGRNLGSIFSQAQQPLQFMRARRHSIGGCPGSKNTMGLLSALPVP